MRAAILLALLSLASPAVAATADPTAAVCRKLGGREPPAADRPTAAQARTLRGCDAEALYYGEKGPPDLERARLCAFLQTDEASASSRSEDVFSGPVILMQLYANGLGGVRRDLDQATAYACAVDGAPAEVEYRVRHLQALKLKPESKRFDYCDDITSGLASGFCAARGAAVAKRGRSAKEAALIARTPASARPLLAALRKASSAFVEAHGGEVDESGTARAQMVIDEQEATRDAFVGHLGQLVDRRWPTASPAEAQAQARTADRDLNAAHRKDLAFLGSKDNFSTVKPAAVRDAQRAWLNYRDAFVALARAVAPATPPDAVTAVLTRERAKALGGLAE